MRAEGKTEEQALPPDQPQAGVPAWTMPEDSYYSDAADLDRIIRRIESDAQHAGDLDRIRILPGIRLLRQSASSLAQRGEEIRNSTAIGYWMYELADFLSR